MEKILIIYSNPTDTDNIRLDKEHRAIDEILRSVGLPAETVVRRHATTFKDLTTAVAETDYSVFHFSGHGTPDGIYLEADNSESGEIITADRIAHLLMKAQPNLNLAIFMSCFSASAIPTLLAIAPYLITVFGTADDNSSIEFVSVFYDHYLRERSIPRAFFFAQEMTHESLNPVLSRRATDGTAGKALFEVFPKGAYFSDSFLIDLSPAESCINSLDVPRESFLHVLSRKIRLHSRIFDFPRERAVLPIGPYVGILSWKNARDLITCHEVLQMKSNISQDASDAWAIIAVDYNENVIQRYRLREQPAAPHHHRDLKKSLKNFRGTYEFLCNKKTFADTLPKYIPEQYRFTKSTMKANLEMAEKKLASEDFGSVVFHLECVLSSQHDMLDALTKSLTVKPDKHSTRSDTT